MEVLNALDMGQEGRSFIMDVFAKSVIVQNLFYAPFKTIFNDYIHSGFMSIPSIPSIYLIEITSKCNE